MFEISAHLTRQIIAIVCGGVSVVALSLLHGAGTARADDIPTKKVMVTVDTIVTGLDHPWAVEVLPDGAYLVSERAGHLRVIRNGQISAPVSGLPPLYTGGHGGLLDLELDPAFAATRKFYFTASVSGDGGQGTAVFSAHLSSDETVMTDVTRLFIMNRLTDTDHHFGSRIVINTDGSLFFGIGDRGEPDRAQDPQDDAGSILHIKSDGTPADGNAYPGGLPEIWSKGHRNPSGIAIDTANGKLYTVEHGARGGDEINNPLDGRNYGWPIITYGKDYSGADIGEGTTKKGYEQPLYYWDPSIAPGAIAIYHGTMFPEWDGNFLVAALKYHLLARLERDDNDQITSEERLFDGDYGRIRDVKIAPDGAVLLLTDDTDGALLRVSRGQNIAQ